MCSIIDVWQGSDYASGSEYPMVLQPRILNMSLFLNVLEFWIYPWILIHSSSVLFFFSQNLWVASWFNNQAASRELYQSALNQVCIIGLHYFKYIPESNLKIYCDFNGNKLEKYASIYADYKTSCSQVTEWLFYRFWKIARKATVVESNFSTVTGLVILLKQDPTICVFMKTFQNFQNSYFYVTPTDGYFWIYRQFS